MRLIVALMLLASPLSADVPWWDAKWGCRREVVFPEKTSAQHFKVALPTHGLGRPDGRDVRVVTGGTVVPSKVYAVGPGHSVRLVFERQGGARHFVYWNGPAASVKNATIRAGCFVETKSYPGTIMHSLREIRRAWTAAGSQGVLYVPNIHFAHNPLGPSEKFLSRFVGYLRCDRGGEYIFATDSDDASFLLIDGKLVAQWPGLHWRSGRAKYTGTIDLQPGVHRIEYLHAQELGGLLMNAAWMPPGARKVEVIPPDAFVPVEEASVARIEHSDARLPGPRQVSPDFIATNVGQAVLTPDADEFLVKMHFENLAPQETLKEHACRWYFGDGTTSTAVSPDHVYLIEGTYNVTLVLVKGYEEKKLTTKVHAARDWNRQASAIDNRATYYDIIKSYDVLRMEPRHAYKAMYYFEREFKRDDVVRVGRVLLSRAPDLPEETLYNAVKLFAETARVQGKDYKGARKMLLDWEKRMKKPEHAAGLALAAGDIDMWHLKNLEAAEGNYRRVIFSYAEKARKLTLRKALVRMGDLYRWRHDGEKAREFLHRAQSIPVDERDPVQRSLRAGCLARSVEEFLKIGDMEFAYDYLIQWAWEFPEDTLEGYWTELRVKWLIKNKEYPGGVAEVISLLKLNPKSLYAPSLLWLAADCAEATGNKAQAYTLLERILTNYPEAPNKKAVLKRIEAMRKAK